MPKCQWCGVELDRGPGDDWYDPYDWDDEYACDQSPTGLHVPEQ